MLSPHEFATLMLIKAGQPSTCLDRVELDVLHQRQLITLERKRSEYVQARLTARGDFMLRAVTQVR
ncbi:hypothetical protein [Paraburkholderia sp. RL17-373-BIF-A]|uniref:hypothetical protein n=1 Tax=Paraburkholderia sp. RL17-373-BIF-A TaxID=3031629 RepID=UPI0038BB30F8